MAHLPCPSAVVPAVLSIYGGFGGYDGMDRFGGTIRGLVMGLVGMSSGGALGTVLGDSSLTTRAHSSPLRPVSFVETRSTASSTLATATVRLEVVRVQGMSRAPRARDRPGPPRKPARVPRVVQYSRA